MLAPDGVFDVHGHFTPVPAPSREQMQTLCARIAARTLRLPERRALSEPAERALAETDGDCLHCAHVLLSRACSAARIAPAVA